MTLAVYPDRTVLPGLGYTVKWSPRFYNMPTQTTSSGSDIDLGLAQYPLHDFDLNYEFLHNDGRNQLEAGEFKTLMGFFLQIGGTLGRFNFTNPDDCVVAQQLVGVGDGVTTDFVLTRTFGAGGYSGTEPVGNVDLSQAFHAYLNNSSTPVNPALYSVVTATPVLQKISFLTAPTNGFNVKVDMTYFYYCKLSDNNLTFEKFMEKLWLLNQIKIHSCRAGA